MSIWRLTTTSAEATTACGRALGLVAEAGDVVLLSGDLGAGKTQIAKGVGIGLGVVEPVTSPTFNILLVHGGRIPLFHFDLYRLERSEELEDIDYFGTIESEGVSLVEWGDRFVEATPADSLAIVVRILGDTTREIVVKPTGTQSLELATGWIATCRTIAGVAIEEATE